MFSRNDILDDINSIVLCPYFNIQYNIGALHRLRRLVATISWSCGPFKHVELRRIAAQSGLAWTFSSSTNLFDKFLTLHAKLSISIVSFSLALLTEAWDLLPIYLESLGGSSSTMTLIVHNSFSTMITSSSFSVKVIFTILSTNCTMLVSKAEV